MAFTRVTGRFERPDGATVSPIEGLTVAFVPDLFSARVTTGAEIIDLDPVTAVTDENGEIEVDLFSGDSPGISPFGWSWGVTISGENFRTTRFSFLATAGDEVDLASVVTVEDVQAITNILEGYVTDEELAEALANLPAPEVPDEYVTDDELADALSIYALTSALSAYATNASLSAYATNAALAAAIATRATPADITTALNAAEATIAANFATKVELTNGLAGKASATDLDNVFGIAMSALNGLDDKADLSHTHAISDVTGLQTALDDLEGGRFLYLEIGDPVPGGTPAGTVIVRPTA